MSAKLTLAPRAVVDTNLVMGPGAEQPASPCFWANDVSSITRSTIAIQGRSGGAVYGSASSSTAVVHQWVSITRDATAVSQDLRSLSISALVGGSGGTNGDVSITIEQWSNGRAAKLRSLTLDRVSAADRGGAAKLIKMTSGDCIVDTATRHLKLILEFNAGYVDDLDVRLIPRVASPVFALNSNLVWLNDGFGASWPCAWQRVSGAGLLETPASDFLGSVGSSVIGSREAQGPSATVAEQWINVSFDATAISAGTRALSVAAMLGGIGSSGTASLRVFAFHNRTDASYLDRVVLSSVTADDRGGSTGGRLLLRQDGMCVLPSQTRWVKVEVTVESSWPDHRGAMDAIDVRIVPRRVNPLVALASNLVRNGGGERPPWQCEWEGGAAIQRVTATALGRQGTGMLSGWSKSTWPGTSAFATQWIDVSFFAGAIDGGRRRALLSGLMGGDPAMATLAFIEALPFDASKSTQLGAAGRIGPVLPSVLGPSPALVSREATVRMPPGTRFVRLSVTFGPSASVASTFVDDLSLAVVETTATESLPPTPTVTSSPSLSLSRTITVWPSSSRSFSKTIRSSISRSLMPTSSVSVTASAIQSPTRSALATATVSHLRSNSRTVTSSGVATATASVPVSATSTPPESRSFSGRTRSGLATATQGATVSISPMVSQTRTSSATGVVSASQSASVTRAVTSTASAPSPSATLRLSMSKSAHATNTVGLTATEGKRSETYSVGVSLSRSVSATAAATVSVVFSRSYSIEPSLSSPASQSAPLSVSSTKMESHSARPTQTVRREASVSPTASPLSMSSTLKDESTTASQRRSATQAAADRGRPKASPSLSASPIPTLSPNAAVSSTNEPEDVLVPMTPAPHPRPPISLRRTMHAIFGGDGSSACAAEISVIGGFTGAMAALCAAVAIVAFVIAPDRLIDDASTTNGKGAVGTKAHHEGIESVPRGTTGTSSPSESSSGSGSGSGQLSLAARPSNYRSNLTLVADALRHHAWAGLVLPCSWARCFHCHAAVWTSHVALIVVFTAALVDSPYGLWATLPASCLLAAVASAAATALQPLFAVGWSITRPKTEVPWHRQGLSMRQYGRSFQDLVEFGVRRRPNLIGMSGVTVAKLDALDRLPCPPSHPRDDAIFNPTASYHGTFPLDHQSHDDPLGSSRVPAGATIEPHPYARWAAAGATVLCVVTCGAVTALLVARWCDVPASFRAGTFGRTLCIGAAVDVFVAQPLYCAVVVLGRVLLSDDELSTARPHLV